MTGNLSWARSALVRACLLAPLLVTTVARAETDEQRAGARSLATEGAAAFNEGRFKDAVDLFGKAESLVHAPPHLLFLARAHAKLGQFVRAREAYLKVTKEQLAASAPQAFRDAQAAAAQELPSVEPHIGRLVVNVDGADGVKDLVVTVDGQPLSSVLLGVPQPTDPGTHQVAASAPGWKAAPQSVTLRDADRQVVRLKLAPDPSTAPLPAAPAAALGAATTTAASGAPASLPLPNEPAKEPQSSGNGLRVGAFVAAGVGVVGLGLGTVFAFKSKAKRHDADDAAASLRETCQVCSVDDPLAQRVSSLDDDARKSQTLSIVGFAVGGVGIATGVTLFLLSSQRESAAAARLEPFFTLTGGGFRGAF